MYVITGATGNVGKRVAKALLALNRPVKVISRKPEHVIELVSLGAIAAIGDVDDVEFLKKTFEGADAAFIMIPPKWDMADWRTYQDQISKAYLTALEGSSIKQVVMLSSIGGHLEHGAGPVSGLYPLEQGLKHIKGLSSVALRAGYFFENLYGSIGMFKHAGINGSPLKGDIKVAMVHTSDIATKAIEHFLNFNFVGHKHVFVAGPEDLTMTETTNQINEVLGTHLPYITFSKEDGLKGMLDAGLPPTIANGYSEMNECMNSGKFNEGYVRTRENTTPTSLKWFLENEFKHAYNA